MAAIRKFEAGQTLKATVEERFFAPLKRNAFASRGWFVGALALGLILHVAVLVWLLKRDKSDQSLLAKQEETVVEVVPEPPPPPAPKPAQPKPAQPKPPQPKPESKQELEKPATSAPRAPSETKTETAKLDKETHAPKRAAPPTDGEPKPTPDEAAAAAAEAAKPEPAEEAPAKTPDVLKKDAEALDKAKPEPKKKPVKVAKARMQAKPKPDPDLMRQLAGQSALPDYGFAQMTKKAPVYGGTEDARYLSIIFGLIKHAQRPVVIPDPTAFAVVDFQLSSDGSVVAERLSQSSGFGDFDAEALLAVRRASPFPPLPLGAPNTLTARLAAVEGAGDYTLGER